MQSFSELELAKQQRLCHCEAEGVSGGMAQNDPSLVLAQDLVQSVVFSQEAVSMDGPTQPSPPLLPSSPGKSHHSSICLP